MGIHNFDDREYYNALEDIVETSKELHLKLLILATSAERVENLTIMSIVNEIETRTGLLKDYSAAMFDMMEHD